MNFHIINIVYKLILLVQVHLHYYIYYKPIITQTFPETENRQNWGDRDSLGMKISVYIMNKLGMDKHPQPGFNIAYIVGHIFSISLIILIIWLLFKFIKCIFQV